MSTAAFSISRSAVNVSSLTMGIKQDRRSSIANPVFEGLRRTDRLLSRASSSDTWNSIVSNVTEGNTSKFNAMAGTGKFFVGGNWKCNGSKDSISTLVQELNDAKLEENVDVVVAPPSVYLDQVVRTLTPRVQVSGQNSWVGKGGAFTGEISAEMLKDVGAQWVILGHSERRHIIGETSDFIGKKEAYALSQQLKVIACVGELLEEREAGKTFDVIFSQLQATADHIDSWENVVIAYEPVWAIGTGKVASPAQAQEVHLAIRKWLKDNISDEVSSKTRIIYGGSVNGANSFELAAQEDIDGFLVGGASLKGVEFATIVNSVTAKQVVV